MNSKSIGRIFGIFVIVSLLGIIPIGLRFVSAITYAEQCEPTYIGVTKEEYDSKSFRHTFESTIDETTEEAKAARKVCEEEFKQSDFYKNEYRFAITLRTSYFALLIFNVALLVAGCVLYFKTHLNSTKYIVLMVIIILLALASFVAGIIPIDELNYIVKLKGPIYYYHVP